MHECNQALELTMISLLLLNSDSKKLDTENSLYLVILRTLLVSAALFCWLM